MGFKDLGANKAWYTVAIILLVILFVFGILPMPLLFVLIIVLSNIKKSLKPNAKPQSNNVSQPVQLKPIVTSVCPTSNSDDDFCHTQHHAQRMTADDARSELQELKSLLESGMMEKPEYDQRVSEIKAVLK